MPFPINLTNAVDDVTDVVAAHLNNLEAKVGINGSTDPGSLDYQLRNSSSIDPGHGHTKTNSDIKTSAYTITDNDGLNTIFTQGNVVLTLPSGLIKRSIRFANKGGGTLIIQCPEGGSIEGVESVELANQYDTITLECDGAQAWFGF